MYCKQRLSAKWSHKTRHLSDHLLKSCVMRKLCACGKQTLRLNTGKSAENRLENYEFNQKKSRQDLGEMVVTMNILCPWLIILALGNLLVSLNPDFVMISHRTLRTDVLKIFDDGNTI